MRSRPELRLIIFIILTTLLLTACPSEDTNPPIPDQLCICPGLPDRIIEQCESPPHDGNFFITIICNSNETNGNDLDGNPVCRVNVQSSNPAVLALFPPFVEVHPGPAERFVFETVGNLPPQNVSDTVDIFAIYNNVRVDFLTIRVSDSCP